MNRIFKCKNILLCGLFPSLTVNEYDLNKYKEAKGLFIQDPWERVKCIFSTDDMGQYHPELEYVFDATAVGLFVGGWYGIVIESSKAAESFVYTNDANIYMSKSHLYKILANKSMLTMLKAVARHAPKFGFFFGGFTLICSCCEAYRNKSKPIDCTAAGFVVGALCRFSLGLKGMLSGGTIGGVLGSIYGTAKWIRYKLTKVDDIEMKYTHYAFKKFTERLKKGITDEAVEAANKGAENFKALDDSETEESTVEVEKQ